jgi:hypothetical protein
MFTNFNHLKKATEMLYSESKSEKMTLSKFRERFSQLAGFSNFQAVKAFFDKRDEAKTSEIQVVSVIEYFDGAIKQKIDFIDDDKGNKKAEAIFRKLILEQDPECDEDDIEACIENGYYDEDHSDYEVYIVHSY